MTTSAPHVIITTMQHTCAGHPSRHPNRVLPPVYIVTVWSIAQYNATIDIFHQRPGISMCQWQNFRKAGFQSTNNQGRASQPHTHRSYNKISGSTGSYQPNNDNSQFSRGNQNHSSDQRRNTATGPGQHSTREQQNHYANNSSSSFRNYGYQPRGPTQSHAWFDERYNQQYSPPIYPPTPSLNSSFPEALSKSLLQIAENQSRIIEAMKASQEAEAEAYKMSRTNKMRDDNTLFNSIEVYDGSNPAKFEKWIDSIDQATHIGTSERNY